MRLGYQVLLRANQFETIFAADSPSAVGEARKHQPDLIILDLGLPGGDGYVVMERLQANMRLSTIPVIVVSARDVRSNQERALKAGASGYMQKPWNDSELLAMIGRLLGLPDASTAPPAVAAATGESFGLKV